MTMHRTRSFFRKLFTWKGLFTTLGIVVVLIVAGSVAFLWYISNYPNIPAYQEITAYRFLNQGEADCPNPAYDGTDASVPEFLPRYQGWCDEQRQHYYRVPQGTDFFGLQYDWMTALEKPVGKKPLITREYMQQVGYIYDAAPEANPNNPLDLPVGLTWHYKKDPDSGETVKILDITCSACHSSQLTYKGTAIVIDGGAGGHALPELDPSQFLASSIVALTTTYLNPVKFGRFSRKVLADVPKDEYRAAKRNLRKQTWRTIKESLTYAWYNLPLYPTTEGYGRTDGLGRIANTVYGDYLSPDNYKIANAPVNYPHVWDIWAFDWVQWMGSVRQAMARNVNEAMGTRARVNLVEAHDLYENSVMMPEIHCIETTLQHLEPPTWPKDLFGEIDHDLAFEGSMIFEDVCASCHGPFPQQAVDGKVPYDKTAEHHKCTTCHGPTMTDASGNLISLIGRDIKHPEIRVSADLTLGEFADQTKRDDYWEMIHIPLSYIGTDPTSAMNMINNTFDISSLFELIDQQQPGSPLRKPDYIDDPTKAHFADGLKFIGGEVRYKQYREWDLMEGYTPKDEDAVADLDGFGESDEPVAWRAYRPRPLEGVWATAPFLHNGSVPSIYQLLLPAEERDQVFYLGRKEFDPETLGIKVDKFKGAFKYDTSVTGNSNLGHEFNDGLCGDGVIGYAVSDNPGYCRQFTEHERMAILEYLKVHSDGKRPDPGSEPHCSRMKWPEKQQ